MSGGRMSGGRMSGGMHLLFLYAFSGVDRENRLKPAWKKKHRQTRKESVSVQPKENLTDVCYVDAALCNEVCIVTCERTYSTGTPDLCDKILQQLLWAC